MALVPYTVMLFFPGGGPASGASVGVSLHGSNVAVPMFADAGATVTVSSPLTADSMGVIAFYAAPGCYRAELAGDMFDIPIDPAYTDPVWPDVWVHTQSTPASTWTINHCFGTNPAVTLLSSSAQAESDVTHPSPIQTVITFSSPQAGTANLRR